MLTIVTKKQREGKANYLFHVNRKISHTYRCILSLFTCRTSTQKKICKIDTNRTCGSN